MPDEQDVQNERNDRTRVAKTAESLRNEDESRKERDIYGKLEKKRRRKNDGRARDCRSAREGLNGRQNYRGERGPTEEAKDAETIEG